MAIDLSRFRQTFLDESRENLDAMEAGLLGLESGRHDSETINTIFRAAHSIKGGAGTFGFSEIASVTHLLETLLDQMRSGQRAVSSEAVSLLLESADLLRGLLDAARSDASPDIAAVERVRQSLQAMLSQSTTVAAAAAKTVEPAAGVQGWSVKFKPQAHLLKTANDPKRIFSELARIGRFQADVTSESLPPLAELAPEDIHLSWTLHLDATASREQIEDAFAWVREDCSLVIEPMSPPTSKVVAMPTAAARATEKPEKSDKPAGDTGSIRVGVEKVDALINLVGELVITQAMLKQLSGVLDPVLNEKILNGLDMLDRNTRDLQDAVMSVRMLPVDFVFSRFPRVVRDLAGKLHKKVRLKTVGEGTELDKGVIEKIADPLNHLVRNSLDHGLESPEDRLAAGKDEVGTITLSAAHQGGHIVIEVSDDGRGLNRERIRRKAIERGIAVSGNASDAELDQLIFAPGFSTAETVTDVSGRGVGMDVVKRNILALGGQVDVGSEPGRGLKVTIRLPLTLAILDGMSVAVAGETFIIPLNFVVESLQPKREDLKSVRGSGRVVKVRDEYLPLMSMHELFFTDQKPPLPHDSIVVILEAEGNKLAVQVDELVGQQQVVIKNLESNYRRIRGISGATILGDGRVALIVDVGSLTRTLAKAA